MVSYYYLFSLALAAAVQCANSLPLQPSRHLEQTKRSLTVSSLVSVELVRRGHRVYICGLNKECSRQFDSVKRVEEHRGKHKNNQLPATCIYCKQAYESPRGLGMHSCQPERSRQVAALEFLHRCDVKGCKGTFQKSEQLDAHKEDHLRANIAANRANAGHKGLPFEPNFRGPKSPPPKSDAKSGSTKKRKAASPKSGSAKFCKAPKAASNSPPKLASADRSRSQSSHPASVQSPSRSEVTRLGSQSNPRSKSKSPSPPDSQSNPPQGSRSKSESTSPGLPVSVPPKLDLPSPDGQGLSPLGTPKSSSPPLDGPGLSPLGTPKSSSPPLDGSGLSPLGTPKSTLDWPEPPSPDGELYKPQPMNSRPSSQSPSPYY